MRTLTKAIVTVAAASGALTLSVSPALAASGDVYSVGAAARTLFNDQNDVVTVYDRSKDGHGVVGWISVKQADGSWKAFTHVYNGAGVGTARSVDFNVIREGAPLRVYSCLQDGVGGKPYSCGMATLQG